MAGEMVVLGVALRASQALNSTVAKLSGEGAVVRIESFTRDSTLLQIVEGLNPKLIAIGSPVSLPVGLDCLELSCRCEMEFPERKGRLAEQELSQMDIACFTINKRWPAGIRTLIYRGIRLSNELRKLGYSVIEVYPHANTLILFGDSVPRRREARLYLTYLKDNLPHLIPGLMESATTLDVGACHALLNAYTAVLHLRGETLSMGDAQEGVIVIPRYGKNRILTAR